jgi:predicted nucleotidyltransferase
MDDVLAIVEADPASLGLILHGSRATGAERPDSDYDLIRIVTDADHERREAEGRLHVLKAPRLG